MTNIKWHEDLDPQIEVIIKEFGFPNKEDFFHEAVKDKIKELQKKMFFKGSDRVAEQMRKKGVTEKELLDEFDKFKHT